MKNGAGYVASVMTLDKARAFLRMERYLVTLGDDTDADGAAALLGISIRTLRHWNAARRGPPRIRRGRVDLYSIVGLLAHRAAIKFDRGLITRGEADAHLRAIGKRPAALVAHTTLGRIIERARRWVSGLAA